MPEPDGGPATTYVGRKICTKGGIPHPKGPFMRCKMVMASALVLVLLGCADNSGPGGVPNADLHIVQQDSTTPPLVATQASFCAKVGEGREVRLYYQVTPSDSDEFLRFEV